MVKLKKQMWISKDEHQIICPLNRKWIEGGGKWIPSHHLRSNSNPRKVRVAFVLLPYILHRHLFNNSSAGDHLTMNSYVFFYQKIKNKKLYVYKRDNCNSHTRSTECIRQGYPLSRWTKPLEFERDAKTIKKIRQQPPFNYPVCSWFILSVSFCILFLRDIVQTCICSHF